jgi:hypothetical protein
MQAATDIHTAIQTCTNKGAHVCTHSDMMQLASGGGNPWGGKGRGWYGDHGTASGGNWDDEYGQWNNGYGLTTTSGNNDGVAYQWNDGSQPYRCCQYARYGHCPGGYTLGQDTCYKQHTSSKNMHEAIEVCSAEGTFVCKHEEMMALCGQTKADGSAINPFSQGANGWYGNHGTASGGNWDDEYGSWNRNSCSSNNDGVAYVWNDKSYPFTCCSRPRPEPVIPDGCPAAGSSYWSGTEVGPCKQWPGGCCGTYGNCDTYIGCWSSMSQCNTERADLMQRCPR